jgi:cellulose synthase/poly-beta-1,6-N-acetylglucosamine synthase-like glycosyltransferase
VTRVITNRDNNESIELEIPADAAIIDTSTKETLSKKEVVSLLKLHGVEAKLIENSKVKVEEIIPTLRKGKTNIPESFFRDLALKLGLCFLEYNKIEKIYQNEQRSKLITILPYPIISKYKIIPLEINRSVIDLAVDNPLDEKVIVTTQYLFATRKINVRVVSSEAIEWAIDNIYREIHKNSAMCDLYNRTPDQSAYRVLFPRQKYFIVALIAAIIVGLIISLETTLIFLFAVISIGYFLVNPLKIYISLRGFKGAREPTRITKGEMQLVLDEELPVYTVLIPVFREGKMLAQNLRNMYHLNYPKDKLDIKILMEEYDKETINEAKLLGLFGSPKKIVEGIPHKEYTEFLKLFDPILIPSAKVTTKPRACNYGLLRARGELVVIYDAEDQPDPDQLRKAAMVFLRSSNDVVCLQSKLNFYNADENTLTKWFSIEYANWFEFYLQGLDWIEAPIPLGGTSNHFRKKSLDALGRWDPYNVTEDADIGIRLAREKLKTEMIDTYTYEEATTSTKAWIRQRSRWYKGHLQTYLVHMRHPKQLFKDLRVEKFLKFQATFGSGIFLPIINPVLWIITAASFLLSIDLGWLAPGYLQTVCIINLVAGNISYLMIYVVACVKLKKYCYIPYALLMPLYWVLHSIASWRGLIQLIRNPFYWDKTNHGISKFSN